MLSLWAGAIVSANTDGKVFLSASWWAAETETEARAMGYEQALKVYPPPDWGQHKIYLVKVPERQIEAVSFCQRMGDYDPA